MNTPTQDFEILQGISEYPKNEKQIHSVKRSSDGKEFATGDITPQGKIIWFDEINGKIRVEFSNGQYQWLNDL